MSFAGCLNYIIKLNLYKFAFGFSAKKQHTQIKKHQSNKTGSTAMVTAIVNVKLNRLSLGIRKHKVSFTAIRIHFTIGYNKLTETI